MNPPAAKQPSATSDNFPPPFKRFSASIQRRLSNSGTNSTQVSSNGNERDTKQGQDQPQTPTAKKRGSSLFGKLLGGSSHKKDKKDKKDKKHKEKKEKKDKKGFSFFPKKKEKVTFDQALEQAKEPGQAEGEEKQGEQEPSSEEEEVSNTQESGEEHKSGAHSRAASSVPQTRRQSTDFDFERLEAMQREAEAAKKAAKEKDEMVEAMRLKIEQLEQQVAREKEAKEAAVREKEKKDQQLTLCKGVMDQMTAVVGECKSTTQRLQQEHTEFKAMHEEHVADRDARVAQFKQQMQSLSMSESERAKEIARLQQELQAEREARGMVEHKAEALERERQTIRNTAMRMGEAVKSTQQVSVALSQQKDMLAHLLEAEIEEKHQILSAFQEKERAQNAEIAELKQHLEQLRTSSSSSSASSSSFSSSSSSSSRFSLNAANNPNTTNMNSPRRISQSPMAASPQLPAARSSNVGAGIAANINALAAAAAASSGAYTAVNSPAMASPRRERGPSSTSPPGSKPPSRPQSRPTTPNNNNNGNGGRKSGTNLFSSPTNKQQQ